MVLQLSQDGLNLIKESEGLARQHDDGRIEAYPDPADPPVWTIGYGSIHHIDKNRPVREGDVITVDTALRWLTVEIDEKAAAVRDLCKVNLTQGMFDALVSFTFNFGSGALGESTLLHKLNDKEDYEGSAREFARWIHAGNKVLPGLVIRRDKEEALFRKDGFPGDDIDITPPVAIAADQPYQAPELPLKIQRTLKEGVTLGEDCYILNCALAERGFLATGVQPNSYTAVTKVAVEWFQGQNNLKVDGKSGPKTRAALATAIAKSRKSLPAPKVGGAYCRLTRTESMAHNGLESLLLEFISPQGNVLDSLRVVSGAPGTQTFRFLEDGIPESLEPIPQSRYFIADIEWAGKKDDYDTPHPHQNDGIGPVFVPLIRDVPIRDREVGREGGRDDFGFHADWNFIIKGHSPGSMGCVCTTSIGDLEKLVRLLRLYDPRDLFVDWELL